MKVLYIAPEHVSGGFSLFTQGHRLRGNDARWVTFFRNLYGFEEDICFNLWGMPTAGWVKWIKSNFQLGDSSTVEGVKSHFRESTPWEKVLFDFRDWVNSHRVERTIADYKLNDFDIYHFEQGADPYRDGRWVDQLARLGKGIVCFYHGTDLRSRGAFESVHRHSKLNLTSEIDLLSNLPGTRYLYLPIDTGKLKPTLRQLDGKIRISHAARTRAYKGSDDIESVVLSLIPEYPIEWIMIENMSHNQALELKQSSDIFIDQITDIGGWGYGVSSIESLAMGLPTVTRINPQVAKFLGEHPFINADKFSLRQKLIELINNQDLRSSKSIEGRRWVEERHSLDAVMNQLYGYYQEVGFI